MGLFGFKKRGEILDLTEKYRKNKGQTTPMPLENQAESQIPKDEGPVQTAFGFFGNLGSNSSSADQSNGSNGVETYDSENTGEKKKKLAKRLLDMTTKLEDFSNQMYHLQQRIEVLERKLDVNKF